MTRKMVLAVMVAYVLARGGLAAVGDHLDVPVLVAPASAQPIPDHLKCYKVKDPQAKASYTADLGGLVAEPGCTIKVPAVMACVPATKTNVQPTPPGTGGGGTPNAFGCYKIKCPKATLPAFQLNDQFGSRSVMPSAPRLLCAPGAASTPTTTTSTTTSTTAPVCGHAGASCTTGAQCCTGFCLSGSCRCSINVGQPCGDDSDCCGSSSLVCQGGTCQPAPTTTTSTTIPCSMNTFTQTCGGSCPTGLACAPSELNCQNICECATPAQCTAGFCYIGPCGTGGSCPAGFVCTASPFPCNPVDICVALGCASDCTCPSGGDCILFQS